MASAFLVSSAVMLQSLPAARRRPPGSSAISKRLSVRFASALASAPLTAQPAAWAKQAYNVTIIRDQYGIAHVYGKSDADAVFGMIYAQAEDDFTRVETNYINAMGRLADEGQRREALEIIAAETARLSTLITRLLDWARMESGKRTFELRRQGLLFEAAAAYARFHDSGRFTACVLFGAIACAAIPRATTR